MNNFGWMHEHVEAGSVHGHLVLLKMFSDALGKQFLADHDARAARAAQRQAGPWKTCVRS
jgi:hypothetical protein